MSRLITNEEYKLKILKILESYNEPKYKNFIDAILDPKNYETYPSHPHEINLSSIADTGEKAFQRALLNSGITYLQFPYNLEKILWLDGELPVIMNKSPRRMCVDLIGQIEGVQAIVELKYGKGSATDHPEYAALELLTYYYLILINGDKLHENKIYHTNKVLQERYWVSLSSEGFIPYGGANWRIMNLNSYPKLIIAANKSYWNYWFKRIDREHYLEWIMSLVKEFDVNLTVFETEDIDFKIQKGDLDSYSPKIEGSNTWNRLTQRKYANLYKLISPY
jgi:hypothetical protein